MDMVVAEVFPRFWAKVDVRDPGECWEWRGSRQARGYGLFRVGARSQLAHRVAFVLAGGELTEAEPNVLHQCDNPPCCNPTCLHRGTQRRNVAEAFERGRLRRDGDHHPQRKLSAATVAEIRKALTVASVRTRDDLGRFTVEDLPSKVAVAHRYGVSLATIYDVLGGRTW